MIASRKVEGASYLEESPTTVIVVPCYNEAQRLEPMSFLAFAVKNPSTHILFVNDGSTDETEAVLRETANCSQSRISYVSLEKNSGKAEAVRQGVQAATELNPHYIGYLDADLATPLNATIHFINVLERLPLVDCVIGIRQPLFGRQIERSPARRMLGRAFATIAAGAVGIHVYDTQCGAKMFRATPTLKRVFAQPFRSRWIFDVEILARFRSELTATTDVDLRSSIYEQPLDEWIERGGSKLTLADYFKAIGELWQLYVEYGLGLAQAATSGETPAGSNDLRDETTDKSDEPGNEIAGDQSGEANDEMIIPIGLHLPSNQANGKSKRAA